MSRQAHWRMDLIARGLRLRELGLTYSAIAVVYGEYHDFAVSEGAVRSQLRAQGAPGVPRGNGLAVLRQETLV